MTFKKSVFYSFFSWLIFFIFFHTLLVKIGGKDSSSLLALHGILCLSLFVFISCLSSLLSGSACIKYGLILIVSLVISWIAGIGVYCFEMGTHLSDHVFGAMMQSDDAETLDFLAERLFSFKYFPFVFFSFCLSFICLKVFLKNFYFIHGMGKGKRLFLLLCCLAVIPASVYCLRPVQKFLKLQAEYVQRIRTIDSVASRMVREIPAHKKAKGEVFLVVIGESSSRDKMYCYGAPVNNTPWMASMLGSEGWIQFENAYSNTVFTAQVLAAAFEEGNLYTGLKYPEAATILTTAKAAGVKTAWISNQSSLTFLGSPVTSLGETADRTVFVNTSTRESIADNKTDELVLPALREILEELSSEENTLIFVHLTGSHVPYKKRLPNRQVLGIPARDLGPEGKDERNHRWHEEFITTQLLTDELLEKIFRDFSSVTKATPAMFMYFSDHGEDPHFDFEHNYDNFTWTMTRVPFVLWASEQYRKAYPHRYAALENRKKSVFTNDLLYDTVLGAMEIETPYYNSAFDLSDGRFLLPSDAALTLYGEKRISEDPAYSVLERVKESGSVSVGVQEASSLFHIADSALLGIKSFSFSEHCNPLVEGAADEARKDRSSIFSLMAAAEARWSFGSYTVVLADRGEEQIPSLLNALGSMPIPPDKVRFVTSSLPLLQEMRKHGFDVFLLLNDEEDEGTDVAGQGAQATGYAFSLSAGARGKVWQKIPKDAPMLFFTEEYTHSEAFARLLPTIPEKGTLFGRTQSIYAW